MWLISFLRFAPVDISPLIPLFLIPTDLLLTLSGILYTLFGIIFVGYFNFEGYVIFYGFITCTDSLSDLGLLREIGLVGDLSLNVVEVSLLQVSKIACCSRRN